MDKATVKKIRQSVKQGNMDEFKVLLSEYPDSIDVNTPFGTFLHDASTYGMYDIAKLLVDRGIDVNARGGARDSGAITVAASRGFIDIVELLYEKGARIDTETFSGNPLFAAIPDGHVDVVKFLVEKGIDIKATYEIGSIKNCDAYEYARQYGQIEIANYLKSLM